MEAYEIPFGTTEPQTFKLLDNGQASNGTALTVTLDVWTETGTPVAPVPDADWLDRAAGTVSVTAIDRLPIGHYRVRFKITDSGNTVGYYPNKREPDHWDIVPGWGGGG